MRFSKLRIGALAICFAFVFALVGAGVAIAATQQHMLSARSSLQSALSNLQAAQPDKGGHRDNAIKLVQQAISQVTAGIQAAK
jgi:hypothetical protein